MIWEWKRCNVTVEDFNGMSSLIQDVLWNELQLRFSTSTLPGNFGKKVKQRLRSLVTTLKALRSEK